MKAPIRFAFMVLFPFILFQSFSAAQTDLKSEAFPILQSQGRNEMYQSNRVPLRSSSLIKLPTGAVIPDPQGWLYRELDLMKDGFTGHLMELSKWCSISGSAWANPKGEGEYGWEELPYWFRGFVDLAYLTGDKRLLDASHGWIEGVLSSQDSSGYFGPRENREEHDIWPNMIMLYALRTHYEATHDPRVLPFMLKYFRWLTTIPLQDYLPGSWQKIRGGDNLDHIYWLYNQTGESWLLDAARVNHERTSDWTGGIASWHGVNICQGFREPAEYYQQTGDIRYLQATERNYSTVMNTYGQFPGGMFAADEEARQGYTDPRQAAETCSMVEMMHSDEMLTQITGNPEWADRCEEIAFNSLPSATTPDLKGLHYLTAANCVQLDRSNKAPVIENSGNMFSYNPRDYRCCQHNFSFGWPYFAENLWMATPEGGLAAVLYSASSVTAAVAGGKEVTISENTNYPFDDQVEFTVGTAPGSEFPIVLRIPAWCRNPRVDVNGKSVPVHASSGMWISLKGSWKKGDRITLVLPQEVEMKTWMKNSGGISIRRGPLYYSLKIGENWKQYAGDDTWGAYEVYPTTAWNYGLVFDPKDPLSSIKFVKSRQEKSSQIFSEEGSPYELQCKAMRIPQWELESNWMIGALQQSPVFSNQPVETVTLIPMGCAALRITVFPRATDSPDANVWE